MEKLLTFWEGLLAPKFCFNLFLMKKKTQKIDFFFFVVKKPDINISGFAGSMVSVATTQFNFCNMKAREILLMDTEIWTSFSVRMS